MKVIYVLRLKNNKWYVGFTTNLQRRYEQHLAGYGAWWTKYHPPLEIVETREQKTIFDEDNVTKEYMMLHGVDNVRGGTYCQITLPDYQLRALEQEFRHATNRCLICGASDHRMCDETRGDVGEKSSFAENLSSFAVGLRNYFYEFFTILDEN